jgi:hypothetical protein
MLRHHAKVTQNQRKVRSSQLSAGEVCGCVGNGCQIGVTVHRRGKQVAVNLLLSLNHDVDGSLGFPFLTGRIWIGIPGLLGLEITSSFRIIST